MKSVKKNKVGFIGLGIMGKPMVINLIKNDTTVVAHFDVPATDNTNGAGLATYVQFPGTGIKANTKLTVTLGTIADVTFYFG